MSFHKVKGSGASFSSEAQKGAHKLELACLTFLEPHMRRPPLYEKHCYSRAKKAVISHCSDVDCVHQCSGALLCGDEMRGGRKRGTFSRSLEEGVWAGTWAQWSHHHPALLSFVTGAFALTFMAMPLVCLFYSASAKRGPDY